MDWIYTLASIWTVAVWVIGALVISNYLITRLHRTYIALRYPNPTYKPPKVLDFHTDDPDYFVGLAADELVTYARALGVDVVVLSPAKTPWKQEKNDAAAS